MSEEPVHLPPTILRSRRAAPEPASQRPVERVRQPTTLSIARRTDNELILFDEAASESWIVYPPRSAYEFLVVRRNSATTAVVEHHPWTALVEPVDHLVDARHGCLEHGLECKAQAAITAAVRSGYDPFA